MKGWTPLIATIALAMMIVSFIPMAVADGNSLHVELLVDDMPYKQGDTIELELRVYNNGAFVPLSGNDTVILILSHHSDVNHTNADPVPLALTSGGTGVLKASYVVQEEDYRLYFYYEAEVGVLREDNHGDGLHIEVARSQNTVDVNFYGQEIINAYPGQIVTATIETRFGSNLIDPDGFDELTLQYPGGNETDLTPEKVEGETGIYMVNITIPDVDESGTYGVYAHPNTGGHDTAYIHVNILHVWYRHIDIVDNDIAQFELGVADQNGLPVNGADIYIERWGNIIDDGTTNESGLAYFSVSGIHVDAWVTGFVRTANGTNQSFSGTIFNPESEHIGNGAQIIYRGKTNKFQASSEVTMEYSIYYDRNPVGGHTVYYYIVANGMSYNMPDNDHIDGPYRVVASGNSQTDSGGKFSVSFTAPDENCALGIYFESDLSGFGGDYEEWQAYDPEIGTYAYINGGNLVDDETVKIKTGNMKEGELTEVTVEMPVDYDDLISCSWYPGEVDFSSPTWYEDLEWIPWFSTEITLVKNEKGAYEGAFMVPQFINAEAVTIHAGYTDGGTGLPHYNSAVVKGGSGLFWILVIVAVLVICVFVFINFFKMPKRRGR